MSTPIGQFESMKQGLLEGIFEPGLLRGEQLILTALVTISQQLAAIEQALTGKVPVPAVQPSGPSVPTTVALSVPLGLKAVDEFILAAGQVSGQGTSGYETGYITQFPVNIPAASSSGPGEAVVQVAPPPGYVATLIAPAVVSTDDVAAQVQVIITADGKPAIGPNGFVLGPSVTVSVPQYLIVTNPETGLQFSFSNPSAEAVTVYIYAEAMFIPLTFFNKFYETVMVSGYNLIKQALGITGV